MTDVKVTRRDREAAIEALCVSDYDRAQADAWYDAGGIFEVGDHGIIQDAEDIAYAIAQARAEGVGQERARLRICVTCGHEPMVHRGGGYCDEEFGCEHKCTAFRSKP